MLDVLKQRRGKMARKHCRVECQGTYENTYAMKACKQGDRSTFIIWSNENIAVLWQLSKTIRADTQWGKHANMPCYANGVLCPSQKELPIIMLTYGLASETAVWMLIR